MDFPRHVHHAAGASLSVATEDAYLAALADGWSPDPVPVTVRHGDETWVVYTADSLATAIAEGWTVVDPTAANASSVDDDAPTTDTAARKRSKK